MSMARSRCRPKRRAGPAAEPEDLGQPQASRRLCARHRAAGKLGAPLISGSTPAADALIIVTPYGEDVSTAVSAQGLDPARSVGLDTLYALDGAKRRSLMLSPATQRSGATRPMPRWRRRRAGHRDPGFAGLRRAAHRGHHRQHRLRHRAAADRHAGGHRPRRDAGSGLSDGSAGAGRRAGRDAHPGSAQEHRARHRRPALSSQPGCNAACNWACRCWSRRRLDGWRAAALRAGATRADARTDGAVANILVRVAGNPGVRQCKRPLEFQGFLLCRPGGADRRTWPRPPCIARPRGCLLPWRWPRRPWAAAACPAWRPSPSRPCRS